MSRGARWPNRQLDPTKLAAKRMGGAVLIQEIHKDLLRGTSGRVRAALGK